jgi:hypothetical protein
MNYCNITNEPLYHPHMMEASGEMVAAVNEMLLQSHNGVIDVFPAVPSGEPEPGRKVGLYEHDVEKKVRSYEKWADCAFQGLLAAGGFEISAEMKQGRTVWVRIRSKAGQRVVMRNPFVSDERVRVSRLAGSSWEIAEHREEGGLLYFLTEKDGEFAIYVQSEDMHPVLSLSNPDRLAAAAQTINDPRVHEAHTHRRVFLGKNQDTPHYKLLDHFTFDYYSGNYRESRIAAYRLDCGVHPDLLNKDYYKALPRQVHMEGVLGQTFRKISPETVFTPYTGIGWDRAEDLIAEDSGEPDELRRDYIGGTSEATLTIELPRGKYDLLFVSGDSCSQSYTEIEIAGQSVYKPTKVLKAGEFETDILPIAQKNDGYAQIRFRTREGLQWRINVLIVNKNYTYL